MRDEALRPYPEYKESGVPWLGHTPSHWDILPNRRLFAEVHEPDHPEEAMLSVTITRGVIRQQDLLADGVKKDGSNLDKTAYKLVRPGDLVYNKMRAWQGAVGLSSERGIVSPAYVVVRPRDSNAGRYFHYLMRTASFAAEARRWSYGLTSDQWSLRPEHFKMIYCPLPPPHERELIVRYLDHLDRGVRRYSSAKRKLIALLNEQRQAVIEQVATRGLDATVRLRPSGLDWLGDIPHHWEVARLRNLVTRVTSGSRGWSAFESVDGPLFLRVGNLTRDSIRLSLEDVVHLNLPRTSETGRTRVHPGDLLLSITAFIGSVALVPEDIPEAYVSQHVALCRPSSRRRDEFRWVAYFLLSRSGQTFGKLNLYGGTKDGLSLDDVKNFPVLLPPKAEQEAIVRRLDEYVKDDEGTRTLLLAQIASAREYQMRLSADVVTGKVDVSGVAARLSAENFEHESLGGAALQDDEATEATHLTDALIDESLA